MVSLLLLKTSFPDIELLTTVNGHYLKSFLRLRLWHIIRAVAPKILIAFCSLKSKKRKKERDHALNYKHLFTWSVPKFGLENILSPSELICKTFFFFFFGFFRVELVAYGSSQARGQIRAAAASLCHSHSNSRSQPHLQSTPKLMAMLVP